MKAKNYLLLGSLLGLGFLTSCATPMTRHQIENHVENKVQPIKGYPMAYEYEGTPLVDSPEQSKGNEKPIDKASTSAVEASEADNSSIINEVLSEQISVVETLPPSKVMPYGSIALPNNNYVQGWVNYFTGRGRASMNRYLSRSSRYIDLMKEILVKNGLPEDLVYLPVIESGFRGSAKSHAGAVGYWQFVRGSGRDFGLKINSYVDERLDPVRSTEAAAKYLKRLYTLFGDWYLALAAYNAGENRVKGQLMRAETRDFWRLVREKKLYKETREYVPKFIAATKIAKNPLAYGFADVPYKKELSFSTVKVKKGMSLKKLARNSGVNFTVLKKLNPMFRTDYIPSGMSVNTPVDQVGKVKLAFAKSRSGRRSVKAPKEVSGDHFYKVRRGDTLIGVANKYRISVTKLMQLNKMKRLKNLRMGQVLRVQKSKKGTKSLSVVAKRSGKSKFHTVRRNETLSHIAKKHGLPLASLLKFNNLRKNRKIYTGQKLRLTSVKSVSSAKTKGKSYKVKSGDSLGLIAKKHGLSLKALKEMNNLKRNRISVGQVLSLKKKNHVHTVRRGESLIGIAKKYKVTLGKLLARNKIKRSQKILVGAKIYIPAIY